MTLLETAEQYMNERRLRSKTFVYSATRVIRVIGRNIRTDQITNKIVSQFRVEASKSLAIDTVENTITDVITLVHYRTGKRLSRKGQLKRKRPQPDPPPVGDISAAHKVSPPWLKQYFEIAYWTGLRPNDAIELQQAMPVEGLKNETRWVASKTGIPHAFPPATFLTTKTTDLPYTRSQNDIKRLRKAIDQSCNEANVARFTPKKIRQRAVTEWSKVNGQAGAILHGSGMGVMAHYVQPLSILQAAAPSVAIPTSFNRFRSDQTQEEAMISAYRLLPSQGKKLVSNMTRQLAVSH